METGIMKYPPHDYVFGSEGVPDPEYWGKKYFYTKMRAVLAQLGLANQGYDLYGMKHSGKIQLWLATKYLKAIQKQNGHSTMAMPETHLTQVADYKPTWSKRWAKMNSAIFKVKPAAVTA